MFVIEHGEYTFVDGGPEIVGAREKYFFFAIATWTTRSKTRSAISPRDLGRELRDRRSRHPRDSSCGLS